MPALYGEAFGLYVIEAMAAGVPVVQPRVAAFPELIEATGGGVLCAADDPQALAEAIEELLLNPARARALGEAGRRAVFERFSAEAMARATREFMASWRGRSGLRGYTVETLDALHGLMGLYKSKQGSPLLARWRPVSL